MTISYEDIDAGRSSVFPPAVTLGRAETVVLFSVLDQVARAAGHDPGPGNAANHAAGVRVASAGAAFRCRLVSGQPVAVDALLDLAAELLEAADVLLAGDLGLEALALEGVAGRHTEHLVGAGPCEGTPLGGRR
jgi:hypothetical protein